MENRGHYNGGNARNSHLCNEWDHRTDQAIVMDWREVGHYNGDEIIPYDVPDGDQLPL